MGGDGPYRDYGGSEIIGFFIGAFFWMTVAALGISGLALLWVAVRAFVL